MDLSKEDINDICKTEVLFTILLSNCCLAKFTPHQHAQNAKNLPLPNL